MRTDDKTNGRGMCSDRRRLGLGARGERGRAWFRARRVTYAFAATICALSCAVAPPPAECSLRQPDEAELLLRGYRDVVDAYRRGDPAARTRVVQWRQQDVLTLIGRLSRLRTRLPSDGYEPGVFGWSVRLLEVATLVNIDLAADDGVPRYQRDFALSVARHFLDLVNQGEPRPAAEPLTRAIVDVLQQSLKVEELRAYLPRAVRQFPTSRELLLSLGSLNELLASQRLAAAREQRLVPRDTDEALRDAEQAYRQALALAPRFDPARIRLAHVLYRQRRYGEARKELQAVSVPLPSAQDGYLRELFAAAVEEASGQWTAAIEAYHRATAICSTCQVAQFGLARAYASLGDAERSRTLLQAALRASAEHTDPWVVYDYAQAPMFPSLFADLKQLCTPR
jgi:hypothetical protein